MNNTVLLVFGIVLACYFVFLVVFSIIKRVVHKKLVKAQLEKAKKEEERAMSSYEESKEE